MGGTVITCEDEVQSSISPERLFKSFILDADNLLPRVLPEAFKSTRIVEGDGGAGSIKLIDYGHGYKTAKHHINEIDETNRTFKCTILEGHPLEEGMEMIIKTVKIECGNHGGSIYKSKIECHVTEKHSVTEEKMKEGNEKLRGVLKVVEDYLHAHPNEYE